MASSAKSSALRWLSQRSLTAHEVRERLKRRGYGASEIEEALDDLMRLGFLDDGRLAEQVVARALAHNEGPQRIRARLLTRGVPGDVRHGALGELLGGVDWDEIALHVRERYDMSNPKDRARYVRHLVREGFSGAVIRRVTESLPDERVEEP